MEIELGDSLSVFTRSFPLLPRDYCMTLICALSIDNCSKGLVNTVRGHASEENIDGSRLQTNKLQRRIHQLTDGRLL